MCDPWGHAIQKLIEDLQYNNAGMFEKLKLIIKDGRLLDRYYIPTRYPNGLPDITPDLAYNEDDSTSCIGKAENIIDAVRGILETY